VIVNKSIRIALRGNFQSRASLARAAYHSLCHDHTIHRQHIVSAFEVALGLLKTYRRRSREGTPGFVPFVRRPMLKAENQSYSLDREDGRLRIPVRGTAGVQLVLPMSAWHRSILRDLTWSLGSLTVVPGKVLVTVRKVAPDPYEPRAAIALDTNEDSLDGIGTDGENARIFTLTLGGVRQVQLTHARRRRRLARKKAYDARVRRRVLRREGFRERNRVRQRLHSVTKSLVRKAKTASSVIILENLAFAHPRGGFRRMKQRFATWPYGEIHRQIVYKAAVAGVPVIKVNPAWTSKTCPACGALRRDRVGKDFVCLVCDWEMDRQHNAALNILKSALASNEALARAVRFQPGALRRDVVNSLCHLSGILRGAQEGPSGEESGHPRGV